MRIVIFCVVISLISTEDGYHRYLCKSNENEKGTVFSYINSLLSYLSFRYSGKNQEFY